MGFISGLKNIGKNIVSYAKELVSVPTLITAKVVEPVAPVALPVGAGLTTLALTGSPTLAIGAGTGTSVFFGALEKDPKKTLQAVVKAPSSTANVLTNIGGALAEPTKENVLDIFKENPLASTLIVGGGTVLAGKSIASVVGSYLTTSAIKENTEAQLKGLNVATANTQLPSNNIQGSNSQPNLPLTPATKTIQAGTTTRKGTRRKSKKKRTSPYINIKIDNRDTITNPNIFKPRKPSKRYG